MSPDGRLHARPGSPLTSAARGLAWLWGLGPVADEPHPGCVGLGGADDADALIAAADAGRLAAAVIFAGRHGDDGLAPRRTLSGIAHFGRGDRLRGHFTVFDEGEPLVRSSLGAHAVRRGRAILIGAEPDSWWGRLESAWVPVLLAELLPELLARPLHRLPTVGVVRLDDVPGTAQLQMEGRAKHDGEQRRLVRRLARCYERAGAVLNVAVPAEALCDGGRVPLDQVWPDAVRALRDGVGDGAFEPVCHGLLHLVPEALAEGRVDWMEFRHLDEREAGWRLDRAAAWQLERLGRAPATFVAPAWGYGPGALAAARARGLPAWLPPAPAPLLEDGVLRETLDPALEGMHRLAYRPLLRLAAAGVPPTLVLHGRSFDRRLAQLSPRGDVVAFARLALRRDIFRLPRLPGIRWIAASRFHALLQERLERQSNSSS